MAMVIAGLAMKIILALVMKLIGEITGKGREIEATNGGEMSAIASRLQTATAQGTQTSTATGTPATNSGPVVDPLDARDRRRRHGRQHRHGRQRRLARVDAGWIGTVGHRKRGLSGADQPRHRPRRQGGGRRVLHRRPGGPEAHAIATASAQHQQPTMDSGGRWWLAGVVLMCRAAVRVASDHVAST